MTKLQIWFGRIRKWTAYVWATLFFLKVIGLGLKAQYPDRYGRSSNMKNVSADASSVGVPFYLKRSVKSSSNENSKQF